MLPETHMKYVRSETSWVAEVNQQVVGFLCAEVVMRDLHVWEMAVRRDRQGQGLGRQLMNTAIDYASRNRLSFVTLTTFREVPWNEPFYRSLGFEVIDAESMEPRLKQLLHNELQHGFPRELRCAMRLAVPATNEEAL